MVITVYALSSILISVVCGWLPIDFGWKKYKKQKTTTTKTQQTLGALFNQVVPAVSARPHQVSIYVIWYRHFLWNVFWIALSEDAFPLGNIKHIHSDTRGKKSSEILKILNLFQDYINSTFINFWCPLLPSSSF